MSASERGHKSETADRTSNKSHEGLIKKYIQNGAMDLPFFIIVIVLVTVGLVMLYTASYANAYYYESNSAIFFLKQARFAVVGLIAMMLISKLNMNFWRKILPFVYGLSAILLILALALGKSGFRRWLYLGPISLQPSEVAKFAIILTVAYMCDKLRSNLKTGIFTLVPFVAISPLIVLTVLEPHVSATIIMVIISTVIIIVAGGKISTIADSGAVAGTLGVGVLLVFDKLSYALDRIKLWLGIAVDTVQTADNWQTQQAVYALGSGGIFGQGFGKSTQKYLYMPEPQNDFIFAIIGEELGFLGALFIIALFVYFVYRGFMIAVRARDRFSSLLALGITFHIGLQAAFNLMVVSNVIMNTGISLPFFSYGGTSLLMTLGEMGIMLSISRASTVRKMTSKS